jgi:hypothetical protein
MMRSINEKTCILQLIELAAETQASFTVHRQKRIPCKIK